jgi:DNA-binding response OmpR family regulator
MKILIVDPDAAVANFIRKGLQAVRCSVEAARDSDEAEQRLSDAEFDLLILGESEPADFKLLKHVRERHLPMLVLTLTARNKVEDRVRCLDLGADDCMSKPFAFAELAARVRALSRRAAAPRQSKLHIADLEMDLAEHSVARAGKQVELSAREFALLSFFMRNAGRCVTRAAIIQQVWKLPYEASTNLVDVYVNYLRGKIDKEFEPKLIHSVRGAGYVLADRSVRL